MVQKGWENSPMEGLEALRRNLEKREESKIKLRDRAGALIQEITGQDIFDSEQASSDTSGQNGWKARLVFPGGDEAAAYLFQDIPGRQEYLTGVSYSSTSGLKVFGETVELQERKGLRSKEATENEVREAFERAMARPFIAGRQ